MKYHILVSGEIGSWWNGVTSDYVRYVLSQNHGKEVHVGFCSLGGSVMTALEMHQAFKDHGNVIGHAFAMNASASTLAMLGCKKITIVKNSFFLIHNASMAIRKWENQNKEQIDEFVKSLQKTQGELQTIDDVLSQMYADKTGKSVEDIKAQMQKGTWMSAEKALEWGLVDELREDKEAEEVAKNVFSNFKNYTGQPQFKDSGIPPMPSTDSSISNVSAIVDEEGNPTQSFLQKTCAALKSLFSINQQASENNQNNMIKIFNLVGALLSIEAFATEQDGSIKLTQEQMKTINDKLAECEKEVADSKKANAKAADTIATLRAEKDKLEKDKAALEEQIKNLQGAPGASVNNGVTPTDAKEMTAEQLFNFLK